MSELTKEEVLKEREEIDRYKRAIEKLTKEKEERKPVEIENQDDYFLDTECCWLMDNVVDLRNKNAKNIDKAICDIMIHLSNVRKYIKGV